MDFKSATDRLTSQRPYTLPRLAEAFGVEPATVHRWRMDRERDDSRSAPTRWPSVVAAQAALYAAELEAAAADLHRLADELNRQGE